MFGSEPPSLSLCSSFCVRERLPRRRPARGEAPLLLAHHRAERSSRARSRRPAEDGHRSPSSVRARSPRPARLGRGSWSSSCSSRPPGQPVKQRAQCVQPVRCGPAPPKYGSSTSCRARRRRRDVVIWNVSPTPMSRRPTSTRRRRVSSAGSARRRASALAWFVIARAGFPIGVYMRPVAGR